MNDSTSIAAQSLDHSVRFRDWFVLSGVALLTVVAIFGLSETAARVAFPQQRAILSSCFVLNDSVRGVHARPGCQFIENDSESGRTVYQFDDLGYRNSPGLLRDSVNTYQSAGVSECSRC